MIEVQEDPRCQKDTLNGPKLRKKEHGDYLKKVRYMIEMCRTIHN